MVACNASWILYGGKPPLPQQTFHCGKPATLFYVINEGPIYPNKRREVNVVARCTDHPMDDMSHTSLQPKPISADEYERLRTVLDVMNV